MGIKNPESVADHTVRAMFIAFVIAKMEGANAERAALINAIHDLPETRINDLHKIAQNYFTNKREVEKKVIDDQLSQLPGGISSALRELVADHDSNNIEQVIARDADLLECAIQAREYVEQGYSAAQNWIDNTEGLLVTESAKRLFELVKRTKPSDWYPPLKSIKR